MWHVEMFFHKWVALREKEQTLRRQLWVGGQAQYHATADGNTVFGIMLSFI